jgi:hypothetical protein
MLLARAQRRRMGYRVTLKRTIGVANSVAEYLSTHRVINRLKCLPQRD